MIQSIDTWESCEPSVRQYMREVAAERLLPRLAEAFGKQETRAFGAFDGARMTGLFLFSQWEERYFVMSRWLTRSEAAGREMLRYLKETYPGYGTEFTFRPENALLRHLLEEAGATVFPEQRDMELVGPVPDVDTSGIEPLSKEYEPQYYALHRDNDPEGETYWTGEMVAADPLDFCVFLAMDAGIPVGYLDLGLGDGGSNVADLYVDNANRRRGWGRKLLGKAIQWNGEKPLTLQVDVDNGPAIRLYEDMGFRFVPDSGRMDAIWRIDG